MYYSQLSKTFFNTNKANWMYAQTDGKNDVDLLYFYPTVVEFSDTGCIISYNAEGPDTDDAPIVLGKDAISINPINWKLDETLAPSKENKGKLVQNHTLHSWAIEPGAADATINLERGSVVCTTNKNLETNPGIGLSSLHTYDYAEYYVNLRENGLARCSAFLGREAK